MKTHEQFDKLAEQCYVKTGSVQTDHFDYVKFAELIVRECCGEVLCQLYDYSPSLNEQYNAGHEAGLKLAVGKIKQHFGVE